MVAQVRAHFPQLLASLTLTGVSQPLLRSASQSPNADVQRALQPPKMQAGTEFGWLAQGSQLVPAHPFATFVGTQVPLQTFIDAPQPVQPSPLSAPASVAPPVPAAPPLPLAPAPPPLPATAPVPAAPPPSDPPLPPVPPPSPPSAPPELPTATQVLLPGSHTQPSAQGQRFPDRSSASTEHAAARANAESVATLRVPSALQAATSAV